MRFPADLWWRSLPLRVIASVFVASVLVLVLGGFLLMQQASSGVIKGKEQVASDEARQAVNNAQQTLNGADLSGDTADVEQLLLDLALSFANRSGDNEQYEVLLLAPGQFATGEVLPDSIPSDLLRSVEQSNDLLMTPTTVRYRDRQADEPGLAAGAALTLAGGFRLGRRFERSQRSELNIEDLYGRAK